MTQVNVGINVPGVSGAGPSGVPDFAHAAGHAEQLGFESVWIPDLVLGDGTPAIDPSTALASMTTATERIGLGFGVLAVPLRPLPWLASQIATLQHLSGQRVLLGVGVGGFPTAPFWRALGVTSTHRGRRTDTAVQALAPLVRGIQTPVGDPAVNLTLAPEAAMPPLLVGGTSHAALRRAAAYGDAWFPSLLSSDELRDGVRRLTALAEERGRACPSVTVGVHYLPTEQAHSSFVRSLIDDHGRDPDQADTIALAGNAEQIAAGMHDYITAGADRLVLAPTGPDWAHQSDTLAHAQALL